MSISFSLILGFIITVIISFVIGTFAKRKDNSIKNYFFGDKNLNVSHIVNLMLSTSFSMNGLIYQTWLGYSIGWASIFIQVIWCISFILLAKRASKVQTLTTKYGTLHGSIASQFGSNAGKIASIATVIGFTMLVGWELIVGTSLFSSVAPNNNQLKYILIFSLAGIGGIYTISGGLKGNLKANIFQNLFAICVMIGIVIFLINHNYSTNTTIALGSLGALFTNIGIVGFITNAIFSLSWQFVDMTNWQALASQKEGKSPKHALWWSSIWVLLFPGAIGTVFGILLRGVPDLNPDNIFQQIINIFSNHPIFLVIVSAGFIATMLSTIDGLMLASGQVVTWDLTHHKSILNILSKKEEERTEEIKKEEKKIINLTRYWIFGIGIVGSSLFCWLTINFKINIFDLVYIVVGAQMVLLPVVLSLLFGKSDSNKRFGFLSILTGLLAVVILDIIGITMQGVNLNLPFIGGFIKTGADILPWSPLVALIISSAWAFGFSNKKNK